MRIYNAEIIFQILRNIIPQSFNLKPRAPPSSRRRYPEERVASLRRDPRVGRGRGRRRRRDTVIARESTRFSARHRHRAVATSRSPRPVAAELPADERRLRPVRHALSSPPSVFRSLPLSLPRPPCPFLFHRPSPPFSL